VDAENGNTLWWDAIVLEMSNVRVAFEEYDGELTQDRKPKGYKFVSTHMVFDVKLRVVLIREFLVLLHRNRRENR
jgi:hypothetical protein